jgi:uncharacterized protein YbjT (DUF2867 family)
MAPVLVTGAAGGRQGSTGRLVLDLLLERGLPVRAFVHTDDDRAAALRERGVEVVVGDVRDIADIGPALRGARRAFFTYPVTRGMVDAAGAFAVAAREAGVERVVAVSQLAAGPDAGTPHMRQHWVAEQVLDHAGVGAVHLRAGVFYENLAVQVAARGELALPLGSERTVLPLIAALDVARVGAGLLAEPGPVDPVHWLTGDVRTVAEAVAAFGVGYRDLPVPEWEAGAAALYRDDRAVEHLTALWALLKLIGSGHDLYQVSGAIEQLGGRPPTALEEFVRARAAAAVSG